MLSSIPGFFQRAAVIVTVLKCGENQGMSDLFTHCKSFPYPLNNMIRSQRLEVQTMETDPASNPGSATY